jgi:hypothetical protein
MGKEALGKGASGGTVYGVLTFCVEAERALALSEVAFYPLVCLLDPSS